MYDRLTNTHGLNNLIWVWNGQDAAWYPGDDVVDIIGEDTYPGEQVYTPQTARFMQATEYTHAEKMIIMSENGCLFDPDLAIRDSAMWGLFCTWGGEFVLKSDGFNILSEQYTEEYMVKKVYAHEAVITRAELPDLKTYPLPEPVAEEEEAEAETYKEVVTQAMAQTMDEYYDLVSTNSIDTTVPTLRGIHGVRIRRSGANRNRDRSECIQPLRGRRHHALSGSYDELRGHGRHRRIDR